MYDDVSSWWHGLSDSPQLQTLYATVLLIFVAWLANWVVKRILVRGLYRIARRYGDAPLQDFGIIKRLSNIVPALVISLGIGTIPDLPETLVTVVRNVSSGFIVLTLALALSAFLDIINHLYQRRPDSDMHPIKGYLQVIKILVFAIATLLIIAALIDRSPLILLSGLGAMAAVLMLIFQDTLLSLVASVQISSNDLVRVGDWIEVPELNADGDVIDIALHTVKVQNWDKTITMIPTKRLISDSFKNWRGMTESGGRRIKRCLYLDQQSVHFLGVEEVQRLHRFSLLGEYLKGKQQEIEEWNTRLAESGMEPVNTRRLTNIGCFRAYIVNYLRSHPGVNKSLTLMVRQLNPTADGLPLEVYCFTNTTSWVPYEGIQSDIFDHLMAILPEFGLRLFQHPSGADLRELGLGVSGSRG
ncbi:MAG: mechanosensitive ion channel family protein [Gammaproteobacteria bacterium]|nr:mechanosensitive ion channel family protein [Gammaproteobacteria bacterium]